MLQGSQNLHAAHTESRAQNEQPKPIVYILDTEEIIKASWSLFQHDDGAAAFNWLERSPMPPALSAKDLPGEQTQILNIHRIRRLNYHPVQSDEECLPQSILDSEDWLYWNSNLDDPNDSKDDCTPDDESNIEQRNGIEDLECPEQLDVSAARNVHRLVWPTPKSMRQAEEVLVTVDSIEMRRNTGVKQKLDFVVAWLRVSVTDIWWANGQQ